MRRRIHKTVRQLINVDSFTPLKECFPGTWQKDILGPKHLKLLWQLMVVLPFQPYPTTLSNLAERVGMPMKTLHDRIRELRRAGLLTFDDTQARAGLSQRLRWYAIKITCQFVPEAEIP